MPRAAVVSIFLARVVLYHLWESIFQYSTRRVDIWSIKYTENETVLCRNSEFDTKSKIIRRQKDRIKDSIKRSPSLCTLLPTRGKELENRQVPNILESVKICQKSNPEDKITGLTEKRTRIYHKTVRNRKLWTVSLQFKGLTLSKRNSFEKNWKCHVTSNHFSTRSSSWDYQHNISFSLVLVGRGLATYWHRKGRLFKRLESPAKAVRHSWHVSFGLIHLHLRFDGG